MKQAAPIQNLARLIRPSRDRNRDARSTSIGFIFYFPPRRLSL